MGSQLFKNARIFSPIDIGKPCGGKMQGDLREYSPGAMVVKDGIIAAVGPEPELFARIDRGRIEEETDCGGRCLIPGFVDPHTHCCFASLREEEFELRIAGTPYLEILSQGGGILSSVRAVANATEEELYKNTRSHLLRAMSLGTTTIEIKSGYGLATDQELKMLAAIGRVAEDCPADVVITYLGAHAIPPQYKGAPDKFVDYLISDSLPAVKAQNIARFCDIFCEEGVFSIEQSRKLLRAAKSMGFGIKLHADEVNDLGGAGLAAELGAISADHLLAASDTTLKAMAQEGVVANLLPVTAYSLRKEYARARDMIEMNLPLALATDCNPGSSYSESMQFVFGLSVLNMGLSPAEALTGVTLNPAYSLGLGHMVGSLDVGKQGDFLLLDGNSPAILAYHAGVSSVEAVYKKGVRVK